MEESHKKSTTNTLKVICPGLFRSGTMSLKFALEKIGFTKCYHMLDCAQCFGTPEDKLSFWMKVYNKEQVDFDAHFEGYQAICDFPCAAVYQQLLEYYPKAKIVINWRDPEKWFESAKNTVWSQGHDELLPIEWITFVHKCFDDIFQGDRFNKEHAIKVYMERIEYIKKTYSDREILVWNITDGWEPLCKFLEVPVPEEPFPRVNETEGFLKLMETFGKIKEERGWTSKKDLAENKKQRLILIVKIFK